MSRLRAAQVALDMMCQQFLGNAKGCTSSFAQGYSTARDTEYQDPDLYCCENVSLAFQVRHSSSCGP